MAFSVGREQTMGYPLKCILDIEKSKAFLELMARYYVELQHQQPAKAELLQTLYFAKEEIEKQQIEKKARALALIISLQELKKLTSSATTEMAINLVENQLNSFFPIGIPGLDEFLVGNNEIAMPTIYLKEVV